MPNLSASASKLMLRLPISVPCAHCISTGAASAHLPTSVIHATFRCLGIRLRQQMVSVFARMGTPKMIKKYASCAQCLDAPTAKHKTFVVYVTIHFIESRPQSTASVSAKPLTLKILSSNVSYAQRLDASIARVKTHAPSVIRVWDLTIQSPMESANVWPQSIWILTYAKIVRHLY
jgi:hypothetical protein